MNIVVRTDASRTIGYGHVMRCLTLAAELRERHAAVSFICREQADDLCDLITEQGFKVSRLRAPEVATPAEAQPIHASWLGASWQADAEQTAAVIASRGAMPDWLVVDHYALDERWENALRSSARHIMVIDDLADRKHECDQLLDQNYFPNAMERYADLLPAYCSRFLGAEHVLLREEFRMAARIPLTARQPRLLIFFGGADPTGQSEVALDAAISFDSSLAIDVILGRSNPRADVMQMRCQHLPRIRVFRHADNMAELMANATLCLGAGGIATFERLYMGLPSIVVATAENQREPLQSLADLGCIEYLGEAAHVGKADWIAALTRWQARAVEQTTLPVGTRTDRVVAAMHVSLAPFGERHIERTFQFLQDAELRAGFAMREPPEWHRHVRYWRDKLLNAGESVFAIETQGEHVGNCGVKPIPGSGSCEGWLYLGRPMEKRTGVGEVALRRLLRIAFRELKLARLYLHVRRDNEAALGLYRKVGFRPAAEPVDSRVWGAATDAMCKLVIAQ